MLPDNRIRLSPAPIDFVNGVGVTGQDHDNYPAPNQQPRFDWMRCFLIGLLSNQASFSEPTQFREGTPWFDLNTSTIKIRFNGQWRPLAEAIGLGADQNGTMITLADVYATIQTLIGSRPTASFSGSIVSDGVEAIPIPAAVRPASGFGSRPLIWVNGKLIDPRKCEYFGGQTPTSIRLLNVPLSKGDVFSALLVGMSDQFFYASDVTV